MEKLEKILEYEFHVYQIQNCFRDKAMKRLHMKLEDVKEDDDVYEYINQVKRDISYKSMRAIDEALYDVKQYNKKRKIEDNEEVKTCTQPVGLCRCSNEFPIEINKLIQ
jgi:hypothetical protein